MYCMECWKYVGLTLTWDVLKHDGTAGGVFGIWINFNMGCIETRKKLHFKLLDRMINLNMG